MASVGTASADIVFDKSQVGHSITGAMSGQESLLGGLGKKMAGIFFGGFAAFKAVSIFKDSIAEAQEAAKVQRQTNAVIESTKGVANVSGQAIGDMANKLSGLAGIDDEVIQSGENVLLTFTNIKNGAGVGNDIFNQATTSALNMSAALGTDLQGSIIQVGKALNDPIKGVTALQRVGVSFTQQQRDQIKALVESGKTMDAQKIILKELNTEFGGAAEAAADPAQRLGVVWKNLEEQVGGLVLPILNKAATFLSDKLPGAIDKTKKFLAPLVTDVKAFFAAFRGEGVTSDGIVGQFEKFGVKAREIVDVVLPKLQALGNWLKDNWKTALMAAGAAFLLFTGPVTFIVAAIALLYIRFQGVRDFIGNAVKFISEQFGHFREFVQQIFPQVQEAIGHFVSVAKAAWNLFGDDILKVAKAVWSQIQLAIETAVGIIENIIKVVLAVINGDWGKAWDGIKGILATVWKYITGTVSNGLGALSGLFGGVLDAIGAAWSGLWEGMKGVVDNIWVGIQNAVRDGINIVIDAVNLLIKAYNLLPGHKDIALVKHLLDVKHGGGSAADLDFGGDPDHKQYFAAGGWVKGPPGSPQLAVVHGGEYVLSREELSGMGSSVPAPAAAAWASNRPIQLVWKDGRVLAEIASGELEGRRLEYS